MTARTRRLDPLPRRSLGKLLLVALLAGACADSGSPLGPTPPSPSPSPTSTPPPAVPGLLRGPYTLSVTSDPLCRGSLGPVSFSVDASPDPSGRYPGVTAVDAPAPVLELELLDGGTLVRGGIGTAGGVRSAEGPFVWLELVGTGDVRVAADGVAEVIDGTAVGYVEFGSRPNDEGGLGTCKSIGHLWSLRRR
jgi:hypothetical protein